MDSGYDTATEAERKRRYREIRRATSRIEAVRPGAVETASFLLVETKAGFERSMASSTNLESKARLLLGIVVAAASALGLFGIHREPARLTTPIVAAMALTIAALVVLLWVLRAKPAPSPNLSPYVSSAMVREDNRIGLSLALGYYYGEARREIDTANRREARLLFTAYAALTAAAAILLCDAASSARRNDSGHGTPGKRHHATVQSPKRPNSTPHSPPTGGAHPPKGNR